jgi:lipopolysaccharide biosynthesis protein
MIRSIAFYLPQFHPTHENDLWWGKGFTEWTNVARAKPLFKGHYQPRLPSELGFYDLRLPEIREQQAGLAREYGIHGFCYYHYWFMGKRLLNRPIDDVLASGKPDFPFMLCWANETWSRRWLGEESEILIKQTYSEDDDRRHATWLCEHAFSDPRNIRVAGRPAFMIYRPGDLPDLKRTLDIIRQTAVRMGLPEPYLIGSNSHSQILDGFDHVLSFEPQLYELKGAFNDSPSISRWLRNLRRGICSSRLKIYDYAEVKQIMGQRQFKYKSLPCVFVGWDNSARRGERALMVVGEDAGVFKTSLLRARDQVCSYPEEEQIVFINAWNEWAEGNHLEPCQKYGRQFLGSVREVFAGN